MTRRIALLLAVLSLALVACRERRANAPPQDAPAGLTPAVTATAAAAATATPPPPADVPSSFSHAACTPARLHASGDTDGTLRSGGLDRTYVLHVPPSYDGTRETPLVLNLHGFGSNGRQQALYSRMPQKADAEGFITVAPDGAGEPRRWTFPGLGEVDDVAFLRALLDDLEMKLCVDPDWVFVTGMSNGAGFATVLACALPGRFAAIAPVAATSYTPACDGTPPLPVITFRGTDDRCVPFDGGTTACGLGLPVRPAEEVVRLWAEHNGCNSEPARQRRGEHVRTTAYSECRDDVAVILFAIEGGGHTWPGSIAVPRLGTTSTEVDATDEIWRFFVASATIRGSRR
jgi:polyhydroxybutyrate depolymerase